MLFCNDLLAGLQVHSSIIRLNSVLHVSWHIWKYSSEHLRQWFCRDPSKQSCHLPRQLQGTRTSWKRCHVFDRSRNSRFPIRADDLLWQVWFRNILWKVADRIPNELDQWIWLPASTNSNCYNVHRSGVSLLLNLETNFTRSGIKFSYVSQKLLVTLIKTFFVFIW